jgi:hypothetical protein
MNEHEKKQREREIEMELHQVKMRILDFELNDSDHPMKPGDLERFKARRAELESELQGLN